MGCLVLEGAVPKRQKGVGKRGVLSQSPDLAKLNPKVHLNYSIIFTEISFYPETSSYS